jgi:hypothetical protein
MKVLLEQMKEVLRKKGDPNPQQTVKELLFEGFGDREADKIRGQYIRLNQFQEDWIPTIKSMTYGRFELFDLSRDPGQEQDLSKQHPEVLARLVKRLLEINASVMAEAPDWHRKQIGRLPQ